MADTRMDDYTNNLKSLQNNLIDATSVQTSVLVHRVVEDLAIQAKTLEEIGEFSIRT